MLLLKCVKCAVIFMSDFPTNRIKINCYLTHSTLNVCNFMSDFPTNMIKISCYLTHSTLNVCNFMLDFPTNAIK